MKLLKKLLALLLVLAMVLCLTACSTPTKDDEDDDEKVVSEKDDDDKKKDEDEEDDDDEDDEESDEDLIIGQWVYQIDVSNAIAEELESTLDDDGLTISNKLYINLIFEFTKKGAFVVSMEADEDSVEDYQEALIEATIDYIYELAEEQGMSKSDFDALMEEQDTTVEEYVEELILEAMEGALEIWNTEILEGVYELNEKKGCIYVGEDEDELDEKTEYIKYSFKKGDLKITAIGSDGEDLDDPLELEQFGVEFPMVFEKM